MIKVFYTPLEYRHSTRMLLEEAVKHARQPDYSKILYLAPTPVKAADAQKLFHQFQGGPCYFPPETTTISRYCKKMYSIFGTGRILSRTLAPLLIAGLLRDKGQRTGRGGAGTGFSSVIADFIYDLKQRFPDKTVDELGLEFAGMLEALNIPGSVSANVIEAFETFRAYHSFTGQNGLIDEDDMLNACPLYNYHKHKGSILVIDGFYAPTAAEKGVLAGLIGNAEHVFITVPHDAAFYELTEDYSGFLKERFLIEEIYVQRDVPAARQPLGYYSYPDSEEEVEGIARHIKLLYVSGKVKSLEGIVVAFPELHRYAAMVERVFGRYGIPYALTVTKRLGEMRPLLDILCLLSAVIEEYPRLKFSQFLSSKYFKRIPEHLNRWMPSLSLQSGIVTGKAAWLDFIAEGSEVLDVQLLPEREAIERELRWIFKRLLPLEEIKKGASYARYADVLRKLLDDLEFTGCPDGTDEKIREKITEALHEIFEQLAFLGTLHPAAVTLSDFEEAFRHLLNAAFIEGEDVGVRVMDSLQLQGLSPDYLFLGGLVDGVIPGRQQMDYLLPDNAKVRMGLLHLEKYAMAQKFIFENAVKSAGHLHLSYPVMNGDTLFLPSSFLYSGEERRGGIAGTFSKEEYLVRTGKRPLLDVIDEVRVSPSLPGPSAAFRVTDIDAYRACPRRFFIEKILDLKPMDIKEYEVEAATLGTIIHRAMEQLIRGPLGDLERMRQRAEEIIGEIMKDKKMDAYWKQLVSDTFLELLPEIFEKELVIREDGYHSSEVEKSISGEPVKGIKLKGKIDRIDRIGDEVQIIDYKTGTAGLNCAQALDGNENLQLFLYAAILKTHGYCVSRVGIYSIKDMMIKWCPPRRKSKSSRKSKGGQENGDTRANVIDDYIIASLRFLEDAVARMRKGDFTARPLNDYQCRNCHEVPFCPYIQR